MPSQLAPFLLVVAVITLTPGPDMALVLRNGMRGGATAAWWTGLGCCSGIAVHATAAVLGLSAVLAASATAFTVLKLAGAAYLVYLGASALWRSRRTRPDAARHAGAPAPAPAPTVDRAAAERAAAERALAFRQGLVSNLLNPKIALIFLTLIPQFVSDGEPALPTTATLAGCFLALAVVWWRVFSLGVGALGRVLSRPRLRKALERVTGTVLVALGVRVALDR